MSKRKTSPNTDQSVGKIGEQIIENFFDHHYSRIFSFPNPKTKSNAQVADILVWLNRIVFLIEVKSRDTSAIPIDEWAQDRITKSVNDQIIKNYNRIKSQEEIFLNNAYYHTKLDCEGITSIIGIVVLVHDEDCSLEPSTALSDIYTKDLPIHVFSWNILKQITKEIDTVIDFYYYLKDRFKLLKNTDIRLNCEFNVLGYYKMNNNKFPSDKVDFSKVLFWQDYKTGMAEQILKRDIHNKYSIWIDKIENVFSDQRKLFHDIPVGLYFAWECGVMSRRERAMGGEKLNTVQHWFESGKSSRQFAYRNSASGNWMIFYFSKTPPQMQQKELQRLVRLKLIQLIHDKSFNFCVYGLGFQVSISHPPKLLCLANAIVLGADVVAGKYTQEEVNEAKKIWGDGEAYKISEFPRN